MRLVLKEKPREMTKAESFAYYQACEPREMFDVKETFLALPRKAEIFGSARCGCCGEMTGEKWLRERKSVPWYALRAAIQNIPRSVRQ